MLNYVVIIRNFWTGKNVPFELTEECPHLFKKYRKHQWLCQVLAFLDQNKPFIIYSDTSYDCNEAVLSQEHEIECKIQERPIGY